MSDLETLRELWLEIGLPEEAFAAHEDPAFVEEIIAEHNEALTVGATGVPAARMADSDMAIVGAQPIEIYRRWIERKLASQAAGGQTFERSS